MARISTYRNMDVKNQNSRFCGDAFSVLIVRLLGKAQLIVSFFRRTKPKIGQLNFWGHLSHT